MARIRKTYDKNGVMIESNNITDYVRFINENRIEEVHISDIHYFDQELDFLLSTPSLKIINITSQYIKYFHNLYSLENLEVLILDEPSAQFDFSKMKSSITKLYLGYNKSIVGLDTLRGLEVLNISNYKSNKNEIISFLASNLDLQSLSLIRCKIDTSALVKVNIKLESMKTMELDSIENKLCNLLVNITPNLEKLSLTAIHKGLDFSTLQISPQLKELFIADTKGLKNIHVLNQYPQIERLVLLNCKFEDESLADLKLDYIK